MVFSKDILEKDRHTIQLVPGVMELFIVLFSDDVTLLVATPTGPQNQIRHTDTH